MPLIFGPVRVERPYERGVEVHFIDDGKFNYRDRGKRLSFNVKNIFAEDYSLELEEKITKKQREAMVNNGKDTSTWPVLGLDAHPTKVGFYVLNKKEQKTVIDIFSKFVELHELYATVQYCNEKKYRTKEYWIKEKIDKHGNRIPAEKAGDEPFCSLVFLSIPMGCVLWVPQARAISTVTTKTAGADGGPKSASRKTRSRMRYASGS